MTSRTLLIADDDADLRVQLRAQLAGTAWSILEADSPDAVITAARANRPDAILLDVSMAGAESEALAKVLKFDPVTSHIPIVVLSTLEHVVDHLAPWAAAAVRPTATTPVLLATLERSLARNRTHKPYVLVVDDEPDLVEILTAVLTAQGFGASGALDGAQALEVIRTVKPDALLLDLDMPQLNGWQVLANLKATVGLEGVRVVILTGKDQSDEDRRRGLSWGASDYLLKPCPPEDILRALREALRLNPPAD